MIYRAKAVAPLQAVSSAVWLSYLQRSIYRCPLFSGPNFTIVIVPAEVAWFLLTCPPIAFCACSPVYAYSNCHSGRNANAAACSIYCVMWLLFIDVKIPLMFPVPFSLRCVVRPVSRRTWTVCGPASEYQWCQPMMVARRQNSEDNYPNRCSLF